ncbi:DUF1850 domain-containing protein [Solibacillus sp. MA9]|uniref:DUF1850 domain-containing protein n=1 Tax=Solibacillus palustris TaxID=2908203 RepID=A0ABS9U831_9BACL|nr:DUF1850 domain-containing protein [Solibacillus sp. MA9]MCH7320334.1 DUF1850 domain-containing protein [Solibacillus sp. MA9]
MKKWLVLIIILVTTAIGFIPYERSITFTETRTEQPILYYLPLNDELNFQIVFTHSIHLTDVIESYQVLTNNELKLLSMQYEDVAIGMPSSAEEGQTLTYENGRYTLRYDDAKLKDFTLHIGDVDYKLNLQHKNEVIALKEKLTRGKSYVLKIKKLSFYQKMKGVELYE